MELFFQKKLEKTPAFISLNNEKIILF